jgi:phosphoribosylformylglycinamidine synthase I
MAGISLAENSGSSGTSAKLGIVVFPGSCDERDACLATTTVEEAEAEFLWHGDGDLKGVDAIVIPGGFSYGDYLRPGAIARFSPVMESVSRFAASGGPVLGICNGFQVLCEAHMLPGALLTNKSLRFVCRQVDVLVENAKTPFTCDLEAGQRLSLPVKHTTGCYYAPAEMLDEIEENGQVLMRYAPGSNPNGSLRDIAGVTNAEGNVFGLMPHPEHATDPLTGSVDGAGIFRSLVAHCNEAARMTPAA